MTICKNPWKLIIDFKLPKDFKKKIPGIARPFVYVDVNPIVLTIDHRKTYGVTKLVSHSREVKTGFKILGIRLLKG